MKKAGYRTARIGKYHVAPESVYHFDEVLKMGVGGSRNPVAMAERCGEFIRGKSDKPFFLYFCTSDPHRSGGTVKNAKHNPNPFGNREQGYPGVKEVTYDPDQSNRPAVLARYARLPRRTRAILPIRFANRPRAGQTGAAS
ncbi:MAG: hypothetical protein KatS3mg105_3832 [Gemmatales bacterium]|nr:MAG: hypothetical protein KatS3mg105_3832 [Gemmatales bacterium]